MADKKVQEYLELKESIEKVQREASKALGVLEQEKANMARDFGCKTLKQARTRLAGLKADADKKRRLFVSSMAKFKEKWPMEV